MKKQGLFMLVLCWLAFAGQWSAASALLEVDSEAIVIWSEGTRLQGNLFKPTNLEPGQKLPGILLVHGWGGVKAHLNRNYAPQLAAQGFIVLTFDYKGWGESNGPLFIDKALPASQEAEPVTIEALHIRRVVNPLSMVADARAALNYLAGEKQVMQSNIGIWGSSLGGGVALVTAANDDRIKAYVDQIGAVNFKANMDMITDKMARRWEVQRARGDIPSYAGKEAVISEVLKGYPDWIAMKRYDSFAYVDRLTVPTLIIDAEDEELFAREKNGLLLHGAIKDRLPTRYVAYPGKHYDIYKGDNYINALRDAVEWFVEHLKGNDTAAGLYKAQCASCHSNPQVKAPAFGALRAMSYDKVFYAITEGKMKAQSAALSDDERVALARYLTQGSKDPRAWEATMACTNGGASAAATAAVSGWGYGALNHRYQPAQLAGMTAKELPGLELVWAQGIPGATEMRTQPVITEDTVYVGSGSTNSLYAFDLASGCLKWAYRSSAPPRTAIGYGLVTGLDTPVVFFGDGGGSVHVVDAVSGKEIWSKSVAFAESNILTGSPVLHKGKLYVPISSFEVARAGRGTYECCKDHGGVRALDARNGEILWTYETTAAAQVVGKNAVGIDRWGPSGAPVWTTPAIDEKRNVLYIGTGENYTHPTTETSDAIIALDLDSGEQVWVFQALPNDAYNMACSSYLGYKNQPNCPDNPGPDFDFGASVIIATTADGKDILLAGQKSGDVWALDPDSKGEVLWKVSLSDGTPVGGIHWGMSLVEDTLYVPVADPDWPIQGWQYQPRPGVVALDVASGEIKWRHEARRDCQLDETKMDPKSLRHEETWPDCFSLYGFSGAPTAIDGAVLVGSLNGTLSAFDSETGSVIWQFDSKRPFDTLNGVPAHGGSLDNAGPAIGNGYLVLLSGYSYINQMPGNVILVFKKTD